MLNHLVRVAIVAACLFVVAIGSAFATDSMTDDLRPVIQAAVPIVVGLFGIVGSWLAATVTKRLGVQNQTAYAQTLDRAMAYGLAFAQDKLKQRMDAGPITVDVRDAHVAEAANYVVATVPGAMKALGIDQQGLADRLKARFAYNTTPPEISIAQPTPAA